MRLLEKGAKKNKNTRPTPGIFRLH